MYLYSAVIDLADLYHRYNLIDEAMSIYARLIGRYPLDSTIGMEARLEAAKLVVFESFGIETDRQRAYSWLLEIKDKASTLSKCPEVLEIIGYCSENGIGTSMNRDKAIEYYLDCVNMVEKYGHWEKQRCLCRLVNIYMEERNYRSAFAYLEVLKPNLDQMSQLPFLDATSQAHRMRYYFGKKQLKFSIHCYMN
jgi:TPR repeat protein